MGEPATVIVRTAGTPATLMVRPKVRAQLVGYIPGPRGSQGASAMQPIMTVGASSISAFQSLMFDTSGHVVPGYPNAPNYIFAGVAQTAGSPGDPVPVTDLGMMMNSAWTWTPGAAIYASAGGGLTQTVPTSGPIFQIAKAVTATTIFVEPYESVASSVIDGGNF